MAINRWQCTVLGDDTGTCWSMDTGVAADWLTVVKPMVDAGTAEICEKDPEGIFQLTTLSNESYYVNVAATDFSTDVIALGAGYPSVYLVTRDEGAQNTGIPALANFAKVEIQDVESRYIINGSFSTPVSISTIRDNGNKASDGDIITLNSRNEILAFQAASDVSPVADIPNAKINITYYYKPQ